jgi:hypothetical protein
MTEREEYRSHNAVWGIGILPRHGISPPISESMLQRTASTSYDGAWEYDNRRETEVHRNRLIALAGVIIGIIGLFMKSLITDGESAMPTLNGINPDFADGIPTIWGGLDTWAQVVLVILIIVVVVICVRPDIASGFDRNSAMIVAAIGVALLAYAIIKWMEAGDKADELVAGFAAMAEAGAPVEAFDVGRGLGFLVLIIGTVLVTFAGAMGFMGDNEE